MTGTQLQPYSGQPVEALGAPVDVNREGLIAFRINGDDMAPDYQKGNIVLIDTSQRIPCDSEYLIEPIPGCFMVKTLQVPPKGHPSAPKVRVISRNKQYETQEALVYQLGIVGKVVAKWEWKS